MSDAKLLTFYAQPGPMTDPRGYEALLAGLPTDVAGLVDVAQHLLVHIFWAQRYGLTLTKEQEQTVGVRSARQKLALLQQADPRPLREPRPLEGRQVGNCRDFSVLLATLLRWQGTPARARCGFGRYFLPNHFEDHWVCEYWDDGEWALADAQMDALQREALGIRFDPLHTPRDQFIVAGQAWQMCRRGAADPEQFGIFDMHGWWFIWGNVVRDLLALNKVEILPWDYEMGLFTHPLHDPPPVEGPELAEYDRIAALTAAGDEQFDELRRLFEHDPRLRVPAVWMA